jgi:DNA-binding MarR family transcriptional regulator
VNFYGKEGLMASRMTIREYRLWVIFHQTYDLVTRCKEMTFSKTSMTDQQHQVLWLMELYEDAIGGPLTISDLAALLYRSMNSTSSIIDRMKKNGLVEKKRDLPDERAIRLIMTPKGKEMLKEGSQPSNALIKKLFTTFSDEELDTLVALLKKLKVEASKESNIEDSKVDPEVLETRKIREFLAKLDR